MKKLSLVTALFFVSITAFAGQSPDPKASKAPNEMSATGSKSAPRVFFVNLKNGQTIPQKFMVKFGVEGIAIKPAGEITPGTGHHHLVIDGDPVPAGQIVPADATHLHFGKGQTEAEINLKPGKHKLVLQFANGAHASYGPDLSATVDVIVK